MTQKVVHKMGVVNNMYYFFTKIFLKKNHTYHLPPPFCEQLFESYFGHLFKINFVHEKFAQIGNLTP